MIATRVVDRRLDELELAERIRPAVLFFLLGPHEVLAEEQADALFEPGDGIDLAHHLHDDVAITGSGEQVEPDRSGQTGSTVVVVARSERRASEDSVG